MSPWLLCCPTHVACHAVCTGGRCRHAVATLLVGLWVLNPIEEAVVRNTANATALYMESSLSPLARIWRNRHPFAREPARLDEISTNTPLGKRVVSFKIWKDGGLVVTASTPK